MSVSLFATAQNATFDELLGSMQAGKLSMINSLFTEQVDLIILNEEKSVDNLSAAKELNLFKKKYPLTSLEILHYSNRENSSFIISKYQSGESYFRFYLLLKKSDERIQISQLRIEKTVE